LRFGVKLDGAGHDRGWWSALLLMLVAVLAPTVCLLWFMNEAVNSQRAVARQKLAEAYHGQLALLRDRLDSYWEKRAADLDRYETSGPTALFERCVRDGAADAVICLNRDGCPQVDQLFHGRGEHVDFARRRINVRCHAQTFEILVYDGDYQDTVLLP